MCIFFNVQAELAEAHEVIAAKVAIIEEKEHLIATMTREGKKLARLNQVCLVKMLK